MFVKDYLSLLTNVELKSLAIKEIDTTQGTQGANDPAENKTTLIRLIRLGAIELHKRFNLKSTEFLIDLSKYENTPKVYDIPLDVLVTLSAELDSGQQVKLQSQDKTLYGTFGGKSNRDTNFSVLFPEPFKVQVKGQLPEGATTLSLIYSASASQIESENDFLDLPDVYTQALIFFVSSKAYSTLKADENNRGVSSSFWYKFLGECKSIEQLGLDNKDNLDLSNRYEISGLP